MANWLVMNERLFLLAETEFRETSTNWLLHPTSTQGFVGCCTRNKQPTELPKFQVSLTKASERTTQEDFFSEGC